MNGNSDKAWRGNKRNKKQRRWEPWIVAHLRQGGRRPFGLGSCSRYMPGKGSGCYFNQIDLGLWTFMFSQELITLFSFALLLFFFANTVAKTSSLKEVLQMFHLELREQMILSRAQEFLLWNLAPAPGQAGSISIASTPQWESWIRWSEMKLWKGRSVNLISPVSSPGLLTNQEGRNCVWTVSVDHAWERMKI